MGLAEQRQIAEEVRLVVESAAVESARIAQALSERSRSAAYKAIAEKILHSSRHEIQQAPAEQPRRVE